MPQDQGPTFWSARRTAKTRKREPLAQVTTPALLLQQEPDGSLPPLPASRSGALLSNAHRGFRGEIYFTLGSGAAWPTDGDDAFTALDEQLAFYADDRPGVVQTYVYLCEYNKKELDAHAFSQLEALFLRMRERGRTMLLRFTYEYDADKLRGPRPGLRLRHLEQIKGWIDAHEALFRDTVTAFQLGIFGPWGEGGESQHPQRRGETYRAACQIVPEGTYIQARVMEIHEWARGLTCYPLVGYHNDFMIGDAHEWNTAAHRSEYEIFQRTAGHTVNDGEMPWGRVKPEPDLIDGLSFARQCLEHRLTTLSLVHNYKEPAPHTPYRAGNENVYRMAQWKQEPVTPQLLERSGLPFYPAWFQDGEGNPAGRSVFEYLRDFLGYHLVLSDLRLEPEQDEKNFSVLLTNYGFAAPFLFPDAELVVRNADGSQQEFPLSGYLAAGLGVYGQQTLTATVGSDLSDASFGVRISRTRMSEPGRMTARTANDLRFEDGINWLK